MRDEKRNHMDVGGILRDRPTIDRASKEKAKLGSLKSSGYCHTCDDEVPKGKVFCNGKCSSDYTSRR